MVLDQRIFVTFNPFNVYVTQGNLLVMQLNIEGPYNGDYSLSVADTKPGCVLRQSNVINLLQKERNLVTDEDMEACKNSFNTWGESLGPHWAICRC